MAYEELSGIISTVVTPFDENEEVDYDLLRTEVRYLIESGITAICACGTTGEGHGLSIEETRKIIETVVDEVNGRMPVVAGVIQNSTKQAVRYSQAAKEAGADMLQITPVHYIFSPNTEEQVDHYRTIAEAVELPIILYNVVPWALLQPETIGRILDEVPLVAAIKQSGGDIHLLADLLNGYSDRLRVLAALDDLHYPAFVMGAHGALAAIPTVTPHLSVELWNAVQAGDHEKALDLHKRILTVWRSIDRQNQPAQIKLALELQGRNPGRPRRPFAPATEEDRVRVSAALKSAGLIS